MAKIGKTGKFPRGKLLDDDEGELVMRIGVRDHVVIIDFGTEVKWIGLPAQQAADFAASILKRAREVARETGTTITFDM